MVNIRKKVALCGTFLILCQIMLLPIGQIYAETKESVDEEKTVPTNQSDLTNLVEEIDLSEPRFSWHEPHKQVNMNEEMEMTIFSDKEVSEVKLTVPNEATILEKNLPAGIFLKRGPSDQEWVLTSLKAQNTFSLPITFEDEGMFELVVDDSVATIQVLQDNEDSTDDSLSDSVEENSQDEGSLENDDYEDTPIQRNNVSVGNFASLQRAVSNAVANTETIITITNSFAFTSSIIIPSGRNIRLQATASRTLTNSGNGHHFFVNGGQLTLSDNIILDGGGVRASGITGRFILDGAVLQNGRTFSGHSSIDISGSSQMFFNKGLIKDTNGNSIQLWSGTITMNDGTISGGSGNGIRLADGGTGSFIMNGGTIENTGSRAIFIGGTSQSVVQNGGTIRNSKDGGVYVARGAFSMTGGLIIENEAMYGAGIYVEELGTIDLTRGEIRNNHASIGGGIYFESLTNNLRISSAVDFSGNQSDNHYAPPLNVEQAFPNILSRSSSISEYNHPLNGYDIDYETSNPQINTLTTTSNLENAGKVFLDNEEYSGERKVIGNTNINIQAKPNEGYRFVSWEVVSGTGARIADTTSESTTFTMGSSNTVIQANYEEELAIVSPVDPLDPETEIDPENKPQLPEDQGRLSIDFVSQFHFGTQGISARDQTYFAQPQRLLNEDGTINETEERPNYIQVSDRRSDTERHGWQLAVTQKTQFENEVGHQLTGSQLRLTNQQLATAQDGIAPELQQTNPLALTPGVKRVLLMAQGDEGQGTWIYRFGDEETASESVALTVPRGATPEATTYKSTLTWELSAVPSN
ncbi:WxL domain-containing protein [Enterococcus spodopteracolus]|uniref:WxL domain-containing protein n=1 Tax=Enterococcus spodopteracolus TaxID=3034501 RepID=UPI002647850B|nr:WxL domain-containing protein [Enterococcus spodopteracolus]